MSARKGLTAAVVTLALCAAAAGQAEAPAEKPAPKFDPKVTEVIGHLSDYFKGAKSFSVDITRTVTLTTGDNNKEVVSTASFAMRRPNMVALVSKSGGIGSLVCDGKSVYAYSPSLRKYTVLAAPADVGAVMKSAGVVIVAQGPIFVESLLQETPSVAIMEDVLSTNYAGVEEVDGVKCHHLKFAVARLDGNIWVAVGDAPVVPKVEATVTGPQGAKIKAVLRFDNWSINPKLPDERFQFVPPEGTEKAASLLERGK